MCQFQALPYEYMLFIIRIHEFSDECVLAGIDLCFMDQCMPIYLHATPMFYWVCYVVAVCTLHVPPVVQFGMSARGSHLHVLCHMFKLHQAIKPLFDSQSKDRDDP